MASATPPPVSVVVASHGRPAWLARCLTSLGQQDYRNFEIVVVSDQPDLTACGVPQEIAEQVKLVHFTEPNICRARNLAVEAGAGQIIAFIDDDAVPEPDWLTELARGFSLVRDSDGQPVRTAAGTEPGMSVSIEFADGRADAVIGVKGARRAAKTGGQERKPGASGGQGNLF